MHLHSTHSVALSMLPEVDPRAVLPPMTAYYLMKCGATALVPYYRPGDPAVADAIKGLAGKYSSVLLANHGPVVSGDTLEASVFATEELEETAKLYLLLRGMNPRYLSPEQVEDLVKVFGVKLPEHGHEHGRSPHTPPSS
ncbi:ribulose-5-phosphate 4-epimerase/fuculose-1-phosphate aldolase [Bradyrhizobium sp. LM6.9]